jgi:transmembrane sensor
MLSDHLRKLLKKYLYGKENKEGKELFDQWYDSHSSRDNERLILENPAQEEEDRRRRLSEIHLIINSREVLERTSLSGNNEKWKYLVAASITGVLCVVGYFVVFNNFKNKVVTQYGETKTLTLPDHSRVILNANSSIAYSVNWKVGETREVWLEGEAFFEVVHTKKHQKFVVHNQGALDVEVLGTKFSVSGRHDNYKVILNSGKVRLSSYHESLKDTVTLRPGDMVTLKKAVGKFEKKSVNAEQFTAWRNQKLIFDNTSMQEVIELLSDTYGLNVKVSEPALLKRKLSGSIPTNSLNNLLFGLSATFNLDIKKDGKEIVIREDQSNH